MPRKLSALAFIALVTVILMPAAQVLGAPATVTGTLTIREKVELGPNAVAVITIVGQQADPSAGGIVGYQRINGAKTPVQFSVPYDTTQINPKQSYAMFASIIDGSTAYQTFEPVPVITGGPTTDVALVATAKPPSETGAVTGTVTLDQKASLSSSAVEVAALIDSTTGTMVARQVIASPGQLPIAFSIAVDPGVIDPADTYVVKAAVDRRHPGVGRARRRAGRRERGAPDRHHRCGRADRAAFATADRHTGADTRADRGADAGTNARADG